jgi:tetratricopeptide (TPR) repeat protein
MQKIAILITLIYQLLILSCNGQSETRKEADSDLTAKQLNDSATFIFARFSGSHDSLDKAVLLLDKAINIDSSYYLAYNNKANILCFLGRDDEAINLLDRLLRKRNDLIESKAIKAYILEKNGYEEKAREIYAEMAAEYGKRAIVDSNNIQLLLSKAFHYFFTEGNERALKEYALLEQKFPDNSQVKAMRDVFYSFVRKDFIGSVCGSISE